MQTPKVYIIILNYQQWHDTLECLLSVMKSTYTNFSVFVIDNNSGNNSLEKLIGELEDKFTGAQPYVLLNKQQLNEVKNISKLSKITFIQNAENAGFAAGNNVVLKLLRNEDAYFWLLNPDIVIEQNTLSELVQFTTQLPQESIVGPVIRSYSGNHKLVAYGGAKVNFYSATVSWIKKKNDIRQLDYISGGSLFTHASNLKRLGLLPEQYFLYWEETDWCYNAKQKGYGLYVCTSATCYDKGSTSIGRNFVADYYYARNGLLFISKFLTKNIPFVLFFLAMRFLKRGVTGRWQRARGIFKGTMDYFKLKPDEAK